MVIFVVLYLAQMLVFITSGEHVSIYLVLRFVTRSFRTLIVL